MSDRGLGPSKQQQQPAAAVTAPSSRMPRGARAWSSMRTFGRLGGSDKKVRPRELPARQGTFDTTRTSDSNNTNGAAAAADLALAWEEERTELEEKIEALELKLKTKEACLQSMMMANASKGSTIAVANNENDQQLQQEYQLSALVVKDQEIDRLETKVKEQGMLLEQLESQQCQTEAEQQRKVQEQAEHMFEEWQQRQEDPSLWEQLAEQSELISRLQADADYHRQQQERERRKLEDVIQKLRDNNHQGQQQNSGPAPMSVDVPKGTEEELQASKDLLQKQNEELQKSLAQSQQEADGYKAQVENLMEMVRKMEQDKQDEIQLLNIVMSQLEGIKQEYGLDF